MKYYVTLKFEETFEVEANTEHEAVYKAEQRFDPTQDGPELVEVYTEEEDYHEI
jgi:hypothetical protein